MEPPPAYAYVFRDHRLPCPPLQKQDDKTDVSQLHAKYWGVSINQDESEWVDAHGELAENDPDGSEVVWGCFALKFLPSDGCLAPMKDIWVRKDYLRIYDGCDNHCQRCWGDRRLLSPTAIITGQPGVGECFFSMSSESFRSQTLSYKQAKVIGFLMPYADALVKPNPFFGMIIQSGGIYLYKMASLKPSEPWIPRCLRLTCGRLLNRTILYQAFPVSLLLEDAPTSSPYLSHLPEDDKRIGSP